MNRVGRVVGPGVALALLLTAALTGVPGCRRGGGSQEDETPAGETPAGVPADDTTPVRGGTLVVGYPADLDVLNPLVTNSGLSGPVLDFLFPLLVMPTFDCRCVFHPQVAKRWEWSEDGLTLTFHLRQDVVWSDGEPLDADDVMFSLGLMRDPAVGSPAAPGLEHLRAEDPVQKLDDHTVAVHFNHRYDPDTMLTSVGGYGLVPEHVLRDWPRDNLRGAPASTAPVTAGLFRVARWERDHELVLERDETSAVVPPPHLDRIVVRVIPEYSTRLLELGAGRIDLLQDLQIEDVEPLQRDHPEITVYRRGQRFSDFLVWNLADDRFADARVRRALAHAVDVETLMAALLTAGGETYGSRATGTITPELCGSQNPDIQPIPHDPAAAAALFSEAGWRDTDGDGWLDRDGRRFSFTLETNSGNDRRERAQVILQEQLRAAGVDVRLQTLEGNAFYDKLKRREFEAALAGLGAPLFVDPSSRWRSDGPYNYASYANARVDELIDRGLSTTDPAEAERCWREMQALIHEDQPYCFLYWRDELVALHSRFRGAKINTLWVFSDLANWWVPAAEQRTRR